MTPSFLQFLSPRGFANCECSRVFTSGALRTLGTSISWPRLESLQNSLPLPINQSIESSRIFMSGDDKLAIWCSFSHKAQYAISDQQFDHTGTLENTKFDFLPSARPKHLSIGHGTGGTSCICVEHLLFFMSTKLFCCVCFQLFGRIFGSANSMTGW